MSRDSDPFTNEPALPPAPPAGGFTRRTFLKAGAWGAAALALGGSTLSRFNTASAATGEPTLPTTPDHWDRNLEAAADALVPRGRPAGALGPDDPGDPDEPGALDVNSAPRVELGPFKADVPSANGCVQIFKGIILLEQEFVHGHGAGPLDAEMWDPQSVSHRVSDVLDHRARAEGGKAFHTLDLTVRQRVLRTMAETPAGSLDREAFLLLQNFLTIGFYSGYPGMIVPDDPRHGWRVVGYAGHFAPPFGAGARNRDAEIALIHRRKRQLAARGVDTGELDDLERAVNADWDHFERYENGWRV